MLSVSIFIPYTPTGAISLPCVHLLYVYFNTKMAKLHHECNQNAVVSLFCINDIVQS